MHQEWKVGLLTFHHKATVHLQSLPSYLGAQNSPIWTLENCSVRDNLTAGSGEAVWMHMMLLCVRMNKDTVSQCPQATLCKRH